MSASLGKTRAEIIENLILGDSPAEPSLTGVMEPPARPPRGKITGDPAQPVPVGHVHAWERQMGASGNWVWVCKCGERSFRRPASG